MRELPPLRRAARQSRSAGLVLLITAVVGLLAASFHDRYLPAVTGWYLGLTVPHLSVTETRFAMTEQEDPAFYACARSVVKRIEDERSIATFAGNEPGERQDLGDGRFVIRSFVDEAAENGETSRRLFLCTVRFDGYQWQVEELTLYNGAVASAD